MKILVISLAGIGDTLIATPLIHELRVHFPDAQLDAFVLWKGSKDLLEGNPHLQTVHQLNLITTPRLKSIAFLRGLRRARYDLSINTHPQSRRAYRAVARLIGARVRLTHSYECSGVLDRFLVTDSCPQDYSIHGVEMNLQLLRLLGKKPLLGEHEMELFLTPAEEQWADDFIRSHRLGECKRLGIHVGSGGTKNLRLKRWPFPNYLALIQRLAQERKDMAVLLFGGPEEQVEHQGIVKTTPGQRIFVPETKNLRQAAALLKRCDSFLSVDTALMHLAAAVQVPRQIVIEAPTLNPTNVPYHQNYTAVPNPVVQGRNLDYYRYDGRGIQGTAEELIRCMNSVTVDAVFKTVGQVLPAG